MLKRAAIVISGILAGWLVVLLVLGAALGGWQERKTKERIAESLQAQVAIGGSDLALLRGRWTLDTLAIRHDDVLGHLAIDVGSVRCELAPLGWALVDRDCGELAVNGVRMAVSSTALFKVKRPKRKPIRADRVVIDDAALVFSPSAIVPAMGSIEISILHAEAGPTLLRTPLSWLFSLEVLKAKLALPANVTLYLSYERDTLTASGSLFGSTPVVLPVQLPIARAVGDAHDEMQQLVELGKDIAQRLVAKRAQDWLEQQLER